MSDFTYQQLMQDIVKMYETLHPPVLYYATQQDIERGKAYISKKTKFTPEFIVCHPNDLKEIRAELDRPLVSLREWRPTTIPPPEPASSDILATFEKSLEGIWKKEPEP